MQSGLVVSGVAVAVRYTQAAVVVLAGAGAVAGAGPGPVAGVEVENVFGLYVLLRYDTVAIAEPAITEVEDLTYAACEHRRQNEIADSR